MRALAANLSAALGRPVQQPAALVQIDFAQPWRGSTHGLVTWNSAQWALRDLDVQNLTVDALRISGSVVIGNVDGVIGGLILSEGIADRRIRVWGYDGGVVAHDGVSLSVDFVRQDYEAADPGSAMVLLADAVGSTYALTEREARIELRHRTEHLHGPRTYLGPETLGPMLAAGTVLRINGIDYTLER